MKLNKKSIQMGKHLVDAMMFIFLAIFYVRYIWTHITSVVKYMTSFRKNPFESLFGFFTFGAMFTAFPLLFSFLIHKKITLVGFFIGFILQWIIFLNTNPYPLMQDNKLTMMELIPKQYRPEIQFPLDDLKKSYMMGEMNVNFPIVIKPTLCSGQGKNVVIVKSQSELDDFFKKNENTSNYMVQNYLSDEYNIELGVLWEKMPWEKTGKIVEISEKIKLKKNTDDITEQEMEDLTEQYKKTKTFNHLISNDLNELFNHIAKPIKGFNAGRYDILITSLNDFKNNHDFKILEVNGIWGAEMKMTEKTFGTLNWFLRRFVIGLGNILTFQGYSPLNLVMAMIKSYKTYLDCDNPITMFSIYI